MISVFGIWLVAANITFLNPKIVENGCWINFNYKDAYIKMQKHTCDEVAAEINKQLDK